MEIDMGHCKITFPQCQYIFYSHIKQQGKRAVSTTMTQILKKNYTPDTASVPYHRMRIGNQY